MRRRTTGIIPEDVEAGRRSISPDLRARLCGPLRPDEPRGQLSRNGSRARETECRTARSMSAALSRHGQSAARSGAMTRTGVSAPPGRKLQRRAVAALTLVRCR